MENEVFKCYKNGPKYHRYMYFSFLEIQGSFYVTTEAWCQYFFLFYVD